MNGQYLDYENCLNVEWAEKVDLLWRLMTSGHLAEQQCLRPRQLYTAKCKRIEFDVGYLLSTTKQAREVIVDTSAGRVRYLDLFVGIVQAMS